MLKKIGFIFFILFFINLMFFCIGNNVINYNNFNTTGKSYFFNHNFLVFSNDNESSDENESNKHDKKIDDYKLYNILLYTGVGFGGLGLIIFSSGMIYSIFVNTKNPDFTNSNEVGAFAVMYSLIGTGIFFGLLCLPFFIASYVVFKRYKKDYNNGLSYKFNVNYNKFQTITNINISLDIKL